MGKASVFFLMLAACLITLTLFPNVGQSQNVWIEEPEGEPEIGVDFRIPSFDGYDTQGIAFANYFYTNIPLSEQIIFQADVPLSHFSNAGGEANFGVGNPYVGLQFGTPQSTTRYDVGIRVPLMRDFSNAHASGFSTQNYSVGAFFPETTSIIANIHHRSALNANWDYRLGGGPEVLIPNGGVELFLKSYAQLLYAPERTTLGAGINGRGFVTADGGDFSTATNFNFGLIGSHDFNGFTTGAYIELPIDENNGSDISYYIGLNVSFEL